MTPSSRVACQRQARIAFAGRPLAVAVALLSLMLLQTNADSTQCETLPSGCVCEPVAGPSANVTSVNCEAAGLQVVPDLTAYTRLDRLSLGGGTIKEIAPAAFSANTQLTWLVLYDNLLESFPSQALWNLTRLERLYLNRNNFYNEAIPVEQFRRMPNLEQLLLSRRTDWTDITSEDDNDPSYDMSRGVNITLDHLKGLTKLRLLRLGANPATCANVATWTEEDAANFPSLEELKIARCNLKEVPGIIRNLTQFTFLDVNVNRLTILRRNSLPPSLETFDGNWNRISHIEAGSLPDTLEQLNMVGNNVREIEFGALRPLRKLQDLNFLGTSQGTNGPSSCSLTVAGAVSCSCAEGLVRSLDGAACTTCPEQPPAFPDVDCPSGAEGAICTATCGSFLQADQPADADSMQFQCQGNGIWMEMTARASCENVVCNPALSPCSCISRVNGTVVDCSHSSLKRIPGGIWDGVSELDVSHNEISVVPSDMVRSTLIALQRIDLSHNRISRLGTYAFKVIPLWYIDLSNNQITEIDNTPFPPYFNLRQLDLRNNFISVISGPSAFGTTLGNNVRLGYPIDKDTGILRMEGNPVTCRHIMRRIAGRAQLRTECDCPIIGSSALGFCPSPNTLPRFQCEPEDGLSDISTLRVCDGVVDCTPSGYDEAVCRGVMHTLTASRPLCLMESGRVQDSCADPKPCFDTINITINTGVLDFQPALDCGTEHCISAVGLVTGRGSFIGATDGLVLDGNGLDVHAAIRIQVGGGMLAQHTFGECDFEMELGSGNPLGVRDLPAATTPAATSPASRTSPQPSWPQSTMVASTHGGSTSAGQVGSTTTMGSGPSDASNEQLSLGEQGAVVAVVCVLLACILAGTAAVLIRLRQQQMAALSARVF